MSQQGNPSPPTAGGPLSGFGSRIPGIAPHRSSATSRLPSPPVSPGLSSPSTPTPAGNTYSHAPWAGSAQLPSQERRGSAGSSRSIAGAPPAGMTTPNSVGVRGYSASTLSRGDPVRVSVSGLARTPLSSLGNSGYPTPGGQELGPPSPRLTAAGAAGAGACESPRNGGGPSSSRSSIQVAVRVRPLCDKERQRGDRIAWEADRDGNVGLLDASGTFVPKHRFDTVFGPETDNSAVAAQVALPLVAPALRGVNGTIFAYGVTSSGKTHTMMGTDADPGVVPRVIRELFTQIGEAGPSRCFSVRLSVMEIYNEVLNDLLDPTRINLKVREDSRSGLVLVEGLLEQAVYNAEQALELIARGDHNRKVSATAFNEDSSRSHTITRIIVESTPLSAVAAAAGGGSSSGAEPRLSPAATAAASPGGDRPVGRRTTACLSLIDLAGSESARAVVSKGQRMEGSYINRSLLTLGTVIHKLAAGAAGHVPFRDSKLTRLLQPSLSGPGARVAVVCNVTPAAAQTDETANTLKFASRAKLIQVTARTNEILDERTLLRRYQKEVADLKRQLADARRLLSAAGIAGGEGGEASGAPGDAAAGGGGGQGAVLATAASSVFAVLGAVSGEEAVAAELQSERDARQAVEIECTMMRIKLTRLQAFLEENGVNVDDVLLAGTSAELSEAAPASGSSSRWPSPLTSEDVASLLKGAAAAASAAQGGASVYGPPRPAADLADPTSGDAFAEVGLRHAASSPHLEGDFGAGPAGSAKPRGSLSGRCVSAADLGGEAADAGAPGGRLPGWSSDPTGARRLVQPSDDSSPSGDEAQTSSAELRAQVAAALGAAGGPSGGDSCPRPRGSVSGTASGSDLDMDEDLNEGIMAQIRDMITEARLSPGSSPGPGPQCAISQSRRSQGDDAAAAVAPGHRSPGTCGANGPAGALAGAAAAGPGAARTTSGCSIPGGPATGGPASVCSTGQHRRSATLSTASSSYGACGDAYSLDMDLELQVLNADREVLHDQLVASEAANERLTAQVTDLRRQLTTYEQLTRHAASELAEIRRLKEAFQARLQRENDALRAQLVQLGVAPAQLHLGPGEASATPPRAPRSAAGPGAGGGELRGSYASGAGQGLGLAHPPPQSPMRQFQPPHQPQQQRHGVQSMAAFGSPAAVAPLSLSIPRAKARFAAAGGVETDAGPWLEAADGETPTRAGSGLAFAAQYPRTSGPSNVVA
ncbi:hypothetical protein PLESTB_001025400 [Pleodorina starrii]|uniref:Kinesin motor domain-containing protein n=1 Tax=Pleodorina starrii TaxID=330485 RepID=A0A9W6F4R0_9CHLO|nr:hypothetical protein PLESTM_001816700 [Pleodorina starrii]GLC55755.1 hypothetical protein PLESTB_001025400 [Pleodorina starrii]GLC68827.1 hypothetical protein PLESTF_000742900 [Pleodorina starrii]